jgi:hypothetical protein
MVLARATHHVQLIGRSSPITLMPYSGRNQMTESQWKKYLDAWIARSVRLKILNEELEEDKCKQSSAHHVEEKDLKKDSS